MAVNPNTTNMQVNREIAETVRGVAQQAGMTSLEVINQLLKYALERGEIDLVKTSLVVKTKDVKKQPSRKGQK